jgi:hypothetical protein
MTKSVIAVLLAGSLVTGCGFRDSRVNPFNWFGNGRDVPQAEQTATQTNPLLPTKRRLRRSELPYQGTPIDVVDTLVIERTDAGAIIRATGTAAQQGPYDVRLIPVSEDGKAVDGVLAYRFEVLKPARPQPVGTERTRKVTVARALTNQDLEGVRTIQVQAARNTKAARR